MHLDLYRTHPDAEAVVHTHSPHATALSCLREDVPAFHYMIGVTGGASLRCARYARFGTPELSEAMLLAIEGRKACLLANHGLICFSEGLDKAMDLAISVDGLCRQYILARQCGTPVVLSDTEMGEVLERFGSYGKQAEDLAENEIPAFDLPVQRDI